MDPGDSDEFALGCGLDYNSLHRNLPDVRVLKKEAMDHGAGDEQ